MQENNSTGIERGHMGTVVTRIPFQVNVTDSEAQHLCPSSTEQLHQMLLWEATMELLPLYNIGGRVIMRTRNWEPDFASQLCQKEDVGEEPFSKDTTPSPNTYIHWNYSWNFLSISPKMQQLCWVHLFDDTHLQIRAWLACAMLTRLLYITKWRKDFYLPPWQHGTWVESYTQKLFN